MVTENIKYVGEEKTRDTLSSFFNLNVICYSDNLDTDRYDYILEPIHKLAQQVVLSSVCGELLLLPHKAALMNTSILRRRSSRPETSYKIEEIPDHLATMQYCIV